MNHRFIAFELDKGDIQGRINGSNFHGKGYCYSLFFRQTYRIEVSFLFILRGYCQRQVIGENSRVDDLSSMAPRPKISNVQRAAGSMIKSS